ncbi:MFS transporter [Roseibaca sp. Y0-43]|uniref:MFS transporter n=1 Tax=Roseibaca sp. Y0-43 TaxID=2816854 RepID=UPI001D0C4ED2|nr:MFS transporter [Roseibaca sp. Y0-43]
MFGTCCGAWLGMAELSKGWAGVVAALGVTTILGYGAIFYAFPILVPHVAAEFAVAPATLFGMFSIGLFLGGLLSSRFGGWLDRFGAPRVMTVCSAAVAALFAAMSVAPNLWVYGALVIPLEAISFMVLYDAAFAALALRVPKGTRQAITRLTLIGGFASTLFWPLTGWLAEAFGWRMTYLVFAGLHLLVALPLHGWIAALGRKPGIAAEEAPPAPDWPPVPPAQTRRAFWLLGASFALTGIVIAALGVHLVPVLLERGLGQTAYLIGMAMGPTQVLVRIVDATLWRGLHPLGVAIISGSAVVCAVLALLLPGSVALALAFAVLFGAGQGLASIVRGAVPLALFGTPGLGRRLGQLAGLRNVSAAAAPVLFAVAQQAIGLAATLWLSLVIALAGLALLWPLRKLAMPR